MCSVAHASITLGVIGFGSFSIHFSARRPLHFPDPRAGLPGVGLSVGLNSPCFGNRELPNGFHPGSAHCFLDVEDQNDGRQSASGDD